MFGRINTPIHWPLDDMQSSYFFFPKRFIDWLNRSELNCRPLFLVITTGTRKLAIYLQVNVFAVVSTIMSDLGKASHQPEKRSTHIKK